MHNSSTYRVGPRGGVYTVDFDGTRHYLDREQARRYIAELTAGRSSQTVTSEASDWDRWAWCFCFAGLAALAGLGHSWLWSFFCGVPAITCAIPTSRG